MIGRFHVIFIALVSSVALANESAIENYNSGWRLNIDNDLWTGQSTDRDYTGGLGFTLSGQRVQQYPVSIDSWRSGLDQLLGISQLFHDSDVVTFHSQQYGMMLFTPDDIENDKPVYDDRPYASLFFLSNSEFIVSTDSDTAFVSRLTVGFLGLGAAESIQKGLHSPIGSTVPNGWQYQVSDGGEPTAMLSYAGQKNLSADISNQFKLEYEANAGFITDMNAGFSWRWGRISSPWWTFNPYQTKYLQQSMPVFANNNSAGSNNEFFVYAGTRINLRLYNAFLQGQFRDSEVTIASDQMQRLVAEAWLGISYRFNNNYILSAFVRGHSEEFKGKNSRGASWGGLVLSRAY
jgi:hypothetical protein